MHAARLEVRSPRLFKTSMILALGLFGVLVSVPIIATVLLVSMRELSAWTFALPLLAVALAALFMPFGFGNPLLIRRVQSLKPVASGPADCFIVQLTLTPRLRTGWRATFEDADDLGWLVISEAGVAFYGDSVSLALPWPAIETPRLQSCGWRGLFICGPRIRMAVSGLANVSELEFAERWSWTLPSSRHNANLMRQSLGHWRAPAVGSAA